MGSIQKTREKLPGVLFWFNLIFLVVSFFNLGKSIFIIEIIINIIFLGTYMIIKKFGGIFDLILTSRKMGKFAKQLNRLGAT